MKTENDILLEKTLAAVFKEHGWKKQGRTWYKRGYQLLWLFNLQKSAWGDLFYENIGFKILSLVDDNPSLSLPDWHASCRLEKAIPETFDGSVVDFERTDDPLGQIQACVHAVTNSLLPFFVELDTPAGLLLFSKSDRALAFHKSLPAQEWLKRLADSNSP